MEHFVITIARQYGSGGRTIGEALAKRLGVRYYDKNLIRLASDESGIDEAMFGRVDEHSRDLVPRRQGIHFGPKPFQLSGKGDPGSCRSVFLCDHRTLFELYSQG